MRPLERKKHPYAEYSYVSYLFVLSCLPVHVKTGRKLEKLFFFPPLLSFSSGSLYLHDTLTAPHPFLSRIVHVAVLLSITCNNERAFVRALISMSKKQLRVTVTSIKWENCEDALELYGFPWPERLSDRGTLTQPERTNQSYLRRLSDQDNNHVIERERERERPREGKVPLFQKERDDRAPADGSLWRLSVTSL